MMKFEKQMHNNDNIAFVVKSDRYIIGTVYLIASSVMLLKNKKVYELKIEINKIFDTDSIRYSLYKDLRDFLETTNYFVIESVSKEDNHLQNVHNKLGFSRADVETKQFVYYKIH